MVLAAALGDGAAIVAGDGFETVDEGGADALFAVVGMDVDFDPRDASAGFDRPGKPGVGNHGAFVADDEEPVSLVGLVHDRG